MAPDVQERRVLGQGQPRRGGRELGTSLDEARIDDGLEAEASIGLVREDP
jgi:hypothetical protein